MHAKIENGKLIKFEGNCLNYSYTEDEKVYYVCALNPTDEDLKNAGYLEVDADEESLKDENTVYVICDGKIVPEGKEGEKNIEEKIVQ